MNPLPPIEHRFIETNGIRLHCVVAGEGEPVVLLHGFPEYWRSWDLQIPALSPHFQVIVPDLRGYGDSDKPEGGYDVGNLADDIHGLIQAFGGKARVVAHDWGGAVAWILAYRHPQSVERLTILNAPHPRIFAREVFRFPQILHSWYMFLFALPWLPEFLLSFNGGRGIGVVMRYGAAGPHVLPEEDVWDFQAQMMKPRVLRCALEYYRTALRQGPKKARRHFSHELTVPARVLWAEKDPALPVSLLKDMPRYVPGVGVQRIPGSGHWVQREAAPEVNRLLLEWLLPATPPK